MKEGAPAEGVAVMIKARYLCRVTLLSSRALSGVCTNEAGVLIPGQQTRALLTEVKYRGSRLVMNCIRG